MNKDFYLTLQSISRDHGIILNYVSTKFPSSLVRLTVEYKNHLDKDDSLSAYILTTENQCVLMGKHLIFRDYRYSEDVFKILIHDWNKNDWKVLHTICFLIQNYINEINYRGYCIRR